MTTYISRCDYPFVWSVWNAWVLSFLTPVLSLIIAVRITEEKIFISKICCLYSVKKKKGKKCSNSVWRWCVIYLSHFIQKGLLSYYYRSALKRFLYNFFPWQAHFSYADFACLMIRKSHTNQLLVEVFQMHQRENYWETG